MPWSPLPAFPAHLHAAAARIRLACFDVDGTLTDGRLYYDKDGNESKAYFVQDGLGLKLLQQHGIHPVLITARNSQSALRRGADLGIDTQIAVGDKLASVHALCAQHGIGLEQVAFMGDDLPDLAPLGAVGLAVAPANAHPWIAERVHWQTRAEGGRGAARELCDVLLAALLSSWAALRNRDKGPANGGNEVGVDYILHDFTIVALDEQGKESTTLRAPLLERQRGDQTISIATPLFEMPDKDGKHWTLRSETGWLSAKGDEMKLRGSVAGDSPAGPGVPPTTFRTDHLDVFPKESRARTDALVTMTRPGMEQSGVGFEVDSKNNTYHFLSQSKGRYTPRH